MAVRVVEERKPASVIAMPAAINPTGHCKRRASTAATPIQRIPAVNRNPAMNSGMNPSLITSP